MYGILLSALNAVLGYVFRSVLVKFFVFFALWFVTSQFVPLLASFLPSSSVLTSMLSGIPSGVWYFLDLFNVSFGLPILLSSWVSRFVIRRIPVIG